MTITHSTTLDAPCGCGAPAVYHPLIGRQIADLCADCYAVEFPERAATFTLARVAPHAAELRDPALGAP